MYKVLITTSGIGSRLGEYTKYTNKSLVRVGKKATISYLIEAYPKDTKFVITLGHYGSQVRDFLKITYPKHNFTFVMVDKYVGPGTSLGYSMLQAAKVLNEPFIFHASDTIVFDKIPPPDKNWIGGYNGPGSSNYTSFNVLNGKIERIMEKGILDPDFLHIGLVGVKDFAKFWKGLKKIYNEDPADQTLADVDALNELLSNDTHFDVREFKQWYDVGNVDSLDKARKAIDDQFYNLDKPDESIYLYKNFVVKFFSDPKKVEQKIRRSEILKGLTPSVLDRKENFFSYKFIEGDLYSEVANQKNFKEFLTWCQKNLWTPTKEIIDEEFKKICLDFYRDKTLSRVKELLKKHSLKDEMNIINGEKVPRIKDILKKVDFNKLADSKQTNFHGDLILDNIIKQKDRYVLLDWRQNFGGLMKSGDLYYDLAKLNHNLTVNHKIIDEGLFTIDIQNSKIDLDIHRREKLIECQKVLFSFIESEGYDLEKVKLLTPLIWLNSSPLHHKPYDLFLFYFGKYNLWKVLNEKN